MTAIVKDSIPVDSAKENFLLSGVHASTTLSAKAKEEEEQKEVSPTQKRSRLMPTGGSAKLVLTDNSAAMVEIKAVIDRMSSEQRTAFTQALSRFKSDVEQVKAALAEVKNPTAPTLSEINAVIKPASLAREGAQDALKVAKAAGASSKSETSIWFIMEQFMVNDVMGMNNLEMSAAMKQVQAQSTAIANVAAGLNNLNTQISQQKSTDTTKSIGFGIGAFLLGVLLAPFTGGLSFLAGIAVAIALPVCNAQDNGNGATDPRFDFLSDTAPNTSQMLQDQNNQQAWSLIGTNSNQQLSTVMQLHVQQSSQVNVQAAQQFSTMINYASQTMSTGRY